LDSRHFTFSSGAYGGLSRIQVFGFGGNASNYGMNTFIGQTTRVSNTSGTILFAEYANPIIDSVPDGGYGSPTLAGGNYTYSTFNSSYLINVTARHPALPPTPGGDGSGTTGMLNVAFVDGHVETLSSTALIPNVAPTNSVYATIGDALWTNGGAARSD